MIKIVRLFEDNMMELERKTINSLGLEAEIEVRVSNTEDEIIKNAKDADVIISVYESLSKRVLENLSNLKLVMYRSIGFNSIDLEFANKINLAVGHTSKYCVDEVANYVLSSILTHNRRLVDFDKSVKIDKRWDYELFPSMRRLSSQVVGLIGFGNIPKLVAERLNVFGCEIIAYDPFVKDDEFKKYNVKKVSLENLFRKSDYISSHLPLNNKTKGMINKDLFDLCKKEAVFINSSRGGVVNEDDLYEVLKTERISYAILDVLKTETPDLENDRIFSLNNTIITPHIAFYSKEAFEQGAVDSIKNIKEFFDGNIKNAEIVNLK